MSTYTGNAFATQYSAYLVYKGTASPAELNAIQPKIGHVYDISENGRLNLGNIDVAAGDAVVYLAQGWTHCNSGSTDRLVAELQGAYDDMREELDNINIQSLHVAPYDWFLRETSHNLIECDIHIRYNSTTSQLELLGYGNETVVGTADLSMLTRDGMLQNVEYVETAEPGVDTPAPYLKFTFNIDSGESIIRISLSNLVNLYNAANIRLTDNYREALTYALPAIGDNLDIAVGKLVKYLNDLKATKEDTIRGGASSIVSSNLVANRLLISNQSGKVSISTATAAEAAHLSGVTGPIQAQIDDKQNLLTFDDEPTANSSNPVTSDGIKTAIDEIAESIPDVASCVKAVDIASYFGARQGEVVQHIGAATQGLVVNEFYKRSSSDETGQIIKAGDTYLQFTAPDGRVFKAANRHISGEYAVHFRAYEDDDENVYFWFYPISYADTEANEEKMEAMVYKNWAWGFDDGFYPYPITDDYILKADEYLPWKDTVDLSEDPEESERTEQIHVVEIDRKTIAYRWVHLYYDENGKKYYGVQIPVVANSHNYGQIVMLFDNYLTTDTEQVVLIASEPLNGYYNEVETLTAAEDFTIGQLGWERLDVKQKGIATGDNFLSLVNDKLTSSINLIYNSDNKHLELKGNNGAVVAYVDMTEFLVDGMLDNIEIYTTAEQGITTETPYLKFTFNTASGKSVIRVSMKSLVDVYDGANINLTSAFVKAATYSAPAIGDSMNVAIGKLLKGHEDNATALEQKATSTQGGYADSALQTVTASGSGYVTLEAGQKSGNNGAKTQALSASLTMQALATADAQHQGLAEASDVKAALNSVAAGGLKLVDLTTYQGSNGEIVKHIGETTAQYVNGYDYKRTSAAPYPANTKTVVLSGLTRVETDPVDVLAMIRDMNFFMSQETITLYKGQGGYKLYIGDKEVPAVGDSIMSSNLTNALYDVTEVISATYPFSVGYSRSSVLNVTDYFEYGVYINSDGVKLIGYSEYTDAALINPHTYENQAFCVIYGGKLHKIIAESVWVGNSDLLTPPPSWQQWNVQPPTDISGKQDTITGAASTITTSNLTASKVLASDANGKVAATSIATADAEDAVSKRHTQNTDTKIVSGNSKVEVSASGTAITGNGSVSGNLSISGNLNVVGKETVEEIVNIKSENNFITLRDGAQTAIASGSLSGTKVENYDGLGNDLLFGTDASGVFRIGDEGGTLEPIATRDEAANLTDGQLMKWDATNQRLIGWARTGIVQSGKAMICDASGLVRTSSYITTDELNQLDGLTGNVQTQLNSKRVYFGTSDTAASTAIKVITTDADFPTTTVNGEIVPQTGVMICIKPSVSDEERSTQMMFQVGNCKELPIWYNNSEFKVIFTTTLFFSANRASLFVFDGTYWQWVSSGIDNNTTYSAMSVAEGTTGTASTQRTMRADYLQQIIHGQIDKFVGTRAMTEDAYWDLVTAGTVQADTLYITFDNDWEG